MTHLFNAVWFSSLYRHRPWSCVDNSADFIKEKSLSAEVAIYRNEKGDLYTPFLKVRRDAPYETAEDKSKMGTKGVITCKGKDKRRYHYEEVNNPYKPGEPLLPWNLSQ